MSRVTIRVGTGYLDLPKDIDSTFSATKQVYDLNDFRTRNAGFTSSITVPVTSNNMELLDKENEVECAVYMDGLPVLERARMLVTAVMTEKELESYSIRIFFENYNFINLIRDNDLSKLNLADLAIDWDVASLGPAASNTTGLVYPICDWFQRTSARLIRLDPVTNSARPKHIDIHQSGFFIYVKTLMQRIAAETGYALTFDSDLPADFSKLALACPVTWFESQQSDVLNSYIGWSNSNADQTIAAGFTTRLELNNIQLSSSPSPTFNTTTDEWTVNATSTYKVSLVGTYDYANRQDDVNPFRIKVYRNAELVGEQLFYEEGTNKDFYVFASVPCISSDKVYFEAECPAGASLTINTLSEGRIQSDNYTTEVVGTPKVIQPQEWIPQVGKKETFLAALNIYNLVVETDPITKTMNIRPFSDVFKGYAYNEPDFILDENQPIDTELRIESIAQENVFKWNNDNLLRRDTDYTHLIRDKFLPKSSDIVDLPFSACDNSLLFYDRDVDTYLRAKIPTFQTELFNADFGQFLLNIDANGYFEINKQGAPFDVGDFMMIYSAPAKSRYYRIIQKGRTEQYTGSSTTNVSGKVRINLSSSHGNVTSEFYVGMTISVDFSFGSTDGDYQITALGYTGSYTYLTTDATYTTSAPSTVYVPTQKGRIASPLPEHIGTGNELLQIIKITSDTPEARLAIVRSDGGEGNYYLQEGTPNVTYNLPTSALSATWMDELRGESIYRETYKALFDSLDGAEMVSAWFKIDPRTFMSLDYLKPLYVPKFNKYYYINKIEQYKVNGLARLQLIKLNM